MFWHISLGYSFWYIAPHSGVWTYQQQIVLTNYKVACALLLYGWSLDDYVQTKDILIEMGVYFQIQVCYSQRILSSRLSTCFLVTIDTDR
jgi:hypothetical protein